MDVKNLLDEPTEAEREAVDLLLGEPHSVWAGGEMGPLDGHVSYGGQAARRDRHLLLPALHAVQDATGTISRGALGYISKRLTVPPAEAYGVATFYALFRSEGQGRPTVHLCDDLVCGGHDLDALRNELDRSGVEWESSPCLGQCDRAPAVLYHQPGTGYGTAAPAALASVTTFNFDDLPAGVVHQDRSSLRLLRRIGVVDPTSLAAYRSSGGYELLDDVIRLGSEHVIVEMEVSGLRGRGGAAFPIGAKWRALRDASGDEKYVIANGDESEPGTFKDRLLMEGDPFSVVEAMTIFGYVTGAQKGFVYVRGEYPTAEARLRDAIEQASAAGLLGLDIGGSGFDFDLEIRRGAGAYICGEETALFASIEGYRGEPRQKPPFPTTHGLFGKPTGINNIETLLAALEVIRVGGSAFAATGTSESTGPKLFCVSGDVSRPGVYEVPFGTPLRSLLDESGSGDVGAVLMGGAAGGFVAPDSLDTPLSFEGARAAGTTIGSGAIVVFGRGTDFAPVLRRIARFFRDESCGQCVPCRVGTARQEESLHRLEIGRPLGTVEDERRRLDDLARVMTDASICGLGHTASSAIQSAIRLGLTGAPT